MRITKQLAEDLKELIFKKSMDKLDSMIEAHNDMCYDYYLSTLPAKIVEAMKEFPQYITSTTSTIQHLNTNPYMNSLFKNKNTKLYRVLGATTQYLNHDLLDQSDRDMVRKSYSECEAYKVNLKKKKDELYNTLIGLGTKKKVLAVMPQLEKYFPQEVNASYPMVVNPKLIDAIENQPI